jgi:hypothetical protein
MWCDAAAVWQPHRRHLHVLQLQRAAKTGPGRPEATTLSAEEMPAGVMGRIKELVTSGHRAEAIRLYQPHMVRVRYDPLAHDRVFPISPIEAWDEEKRMFV